MLSEPLLKVTKSSVVVRNVASEDHLPPLLPLKTQLSVRKLGAGVETTVAVPECRFIQEER